MAVSNSLTPKAKKAPFSAMISSDSYKKLINNTLRDPNRATRFVTSITSAVSANPALQECDASTIVSAGLLGESLNLSPSPQLGQYYMVPFKQKAKYKDGRMISPEKTVAQFQLGYKGYIQLAIRSGYYKKLNVLAIKEGELVKFDPLNEEIVVNLIEDDTKREALPTIGYYAMFEYQNGFKKAMYWSREKMMAHADKYSMAFSAEKFRDLQEGKIPDKDLWKYSSFWYKDFDGMAYKTMLRQLISKWGIMSIELQTALDKDMAAIHEDGHVDYVDNSVDFEQATDEAPASDAGTAPVYDVDPATGEVIGDADPTAAFFS